MDELKDMTARDDDAAPPVRHRSQQQPSQVWLQYAYSKHHPALQWLPTKPSPTPILYVASCDLTSRPYSDPVRRFLRSYAGQGATDSLFPAR